MIGQKTYDRACDWIVLLDSDKITAKDRAEFVRWLNREPENAIAYEEMSQLWARIGTLGPVPADSSIFKPHVTAKLRVKNSSRNFGRWISAALTTIVLIWVSVIVVDPAKHTLSRQQFVTATNQQHRVLAPDGSSMELGSLSAIELEYSASRRDIRMQRGSVNFNVTRDELRPFVVSIADSTIWALGTQFSVLATPGRIELSVLEGSVRFSSGTQRTGNTASTIPNSTLVLTAGQSLNYAIESKTIELNSPTQ